MLVPNPHGLGGIGIQTIVVVVRCHPSGHIDLVGGIGILVNALAVGVVKPRNVGGCPLSVHSASCVNRLDCAIVRRWSKVALNRTELWMFVG